MNSSMFNKKSAGHAKIGKFEACSPKFWLKLQYIPLLHQALQFIFIVQLEIEQMQHKSNSHKYFVGIRIHYVTCTFRAKALLSITQTVLQLNPDNSNLEGIQKSSSLQESELSGVGNK